MERLDTGFLFSNEILNEVRKKFNYIEEDPIQQKKRIFFDNAGGSFRLKRATEIFTKLDSIPDCPEREHETAKYLIDIQEKGTNDIRTIINAKDGSIATYLTASQAIFEITGIIAENIEGTNIVTTALEHPSAFDSAKFYADKLGKEFRVAKTNPVTGGVDVEEIMKLIDKDTSLLSVIYASNISGAILDIETIVTEARKINPDLFIIVDAVQHAPHGVIDLKKTPVDAMNFAPYKFFGVRGCGISYLSNRAARLPHHKLTGKEKGEWELGSPAPAHFAVVSEIVDYVCWIGSQFITSQDRRDLFVEGMSKISLQERTLLDILLNGTANLRGLRDITGVTVHLDYKDLSKRDFIVAISLEGLDYKEAVRQYEEEGVILYARVATSIYSKRILESFGMKGALRISPLHCNSVEEVEKFLSITKRIVEKNRA
ncbi:MULTISPECIES: aminotransferase class V-fold PLP-dependent enzyme [Bacillus]|uniref:Aminotransferase n=2 Tax=Bacillus TaxID=1386 RepID=A0A0M3RAM4_9BACI|nr:MULTISPECIES: aminotransferase class V-fold PLP-dependent enzyme [Bacillus]ALC83442.1 aminotransferase [Bacillus gobiensis]MBP1082382.1 selenocysteine lyase/cysteine desulfurase [Bacillus capparidis]MED1097359.1 aminotransferase class V-fold PLP-dependent enzyme [Bacillus capparidis]